MKTTTPHPIAVIGAGPVGLAAAAHLLERGLEPIVFEAGAAVGASVREWGHVRVFSPWEFNIDPAAERLLDAAGWERPEADGYPTGDEIVDRYLEPLAALPQIAERLRLGARVVAVAKHGIDKLKDAGRDEAPFELVVEQDGVERRVLARAVIDASGTWTLPNPLGSGGLPAVGERALQRSDRLRHSGRPRPRARSLRGPARAGRGQRPLGVQRDPRPRGAARLRAARPRSSGRSAAARRDASTAAAAMTSFRRAARSAPRCAGSSRTAASSSSRVPLARGRPRGRAPRGRPTASGCIVADRVIAATGFRPDLSLLGELRLDLDDRVEAARALAPLIDPNVHSCGTVPPHGVDELSHPDEGVYMVGMKSYGRAPTFLLRTGYEQVRSVAAALAGDWESARQVEFVLPETGVCNRPRPSTRTARGRAASACCGSGSAASARASRRGRRRAHGAGRRGRRAAPSARRRGAPARGGSSARCRSPRRCRGGSSTTPSRCSWCRCSATSASPRPS